MGNEIPFVAEQLTTLENGKMQFNNLLLSTHLEAQQDLGGGAQRVGFRGAVIAIGVYFFIPREKQKAAIFPRCMRNDSPSLADLFIPVMK